MHSRAELIRRLDRRSRAAGRRAYDLLMVGGGVLGSALAHEAAGLGLDVLVLTERFGSPSMAQGQRFRLNTWQGRRPEQHPVLAPHLLRIDPARFPSGRAFEHAALAVLEQARVDVARVEVRRLTVGAQGVSAAGFRARAALVVPGFGPPRVRMEDAASERRVRAALSRGDGAFAFADALEALPRDAALVGSGPSGLSFVEAYLRRRRGRLVWITGAQARQTPFVRRMFAERYRALEPGDRLDVFRTRVGAATRRDGRWHLALTDGRTVEARALVWCGGFEPPLSLAQGPGELHVVRREGASLGLRRFERGRPTPIYQVGPALDALGLGEWDTGPFAEWFEKGRRLLREL